MSQGKPAPSLGVQFVPKPEALKAPAKESTPEPAPTPSTAKEFKDAELPGSPEGAVLTEKPKKGQNRLQKLVADLQVRFEGDEKKKASFAAQRIFVRREESPSRRVRIGINSGIHTYVLVREQDGKLVAQLYAMIPASFRNLVVPELQECGVEISKGTFTRPSGI